MEEEGAYPLQDRKGGVFLSGLRLAYLLGMWTEDSEPMDPSSVFQRKQITHAALSFGKGSHSRKVASISMEVTS
jgi:hypothetical protein